MARPKSAGLDLEQEEKLRTDRLLDVAAEVFLQLGYEGDKYNSDCGTRPRLETDVLRSISEQGETLSRDHRSEAC
ncbi:hypothetical protein [Edaphobacter sp. HDX4]|uniref:hypothetical protein n=1 Tax=Edaphobacter sp. HDX4 TaxID=2794064 RepID=UPI002FE6C34E